MEDASIRIKVKIDNSVAERDLARLDKSIEKTAANIEKAMGTLNSNPALGVDKATEVFAQIDQQAQAAETTISDMRAKLAEIADQRVNTEAYQQIENEITKCDKKMEELIARQNKMDAMGVKENTQQYRNLQYEIDATAEKLDKLYARKEDLVTRGMDSIRIGDTQEFAEREAVVDALEEKQGMLNERTAEYADEVERVKNSPIPKSFGNSLEGLSGVFHKLTRKVLKYGAALLGARGAMGILRRAVNAYMQANDDAKQTVTAAWSVMGEMLGPVINWLIGLLSRAISWINAFVNALTGINFVARANAKALKKQASAAGGAAKAQKQLAAFDEQNKLSDESSGGGGGSGSSSIDSSIREGIEGELAKISAIVGGATLALGAILAFTGVNVPLGIALMVIGAATLAGATKIAWNSMDPKVKKEVGAIETIVGGALLALGAVLAFSGGGTALGIGLMIAGAASLAAAAALNWDDVSNRISNIMKGITLAVGAACLALGAVLTFSGTNIPLGLGLMVAGAATLAAQIAPNWSRVSDRVSQTMRNIAAIAGAMLLVLGVVLLFTGAGIPLGLGLMAAGGASLAAAIQPKWDSIPQTIRSIFQTLRQNIKEKVDQIKEDITSLPSKIKTAFGNITSWFKNIAVSIGTSIGGAVKSALNGIISSVESKINSAISLINSAITLINKLPAVHVGYVSRVSFPRLAKGGIVNNPRKGVQAVIGEDGAEAVLPLEKNTEWMDILAEKLNGGGGTVVIPIYLSGKKIAEETINIRKKMEFAANGGLA